ncbi:MAG TPA: hypothetical protein PK448_01135 [Bacteroidales bacterium]|nr:hypothetical protein [Bacteroidales bacterium]
MIKKILTYFVLFILLVNTSVKAQTEIKVGVFMNDFIVTTSEPRFYADFYWWCKVPLSVDEELVDDYAYIDFVNATADIVNVINEKRVFEDCYYIAGNCKGYFNYYPEFKDYPRDKHRVPLIIESVNHPIETIVLVPDEITYSNQDFQGYNESINANEFKVLGAHFHQSSKVYNTSFGTIDADTKTSYSRLSYDIEIKRKSFSYQIKIIIPCLLLSIIAYLVFFIPASKLEVVVSCTVTSLLACIAVQFTTLGDIPRVGYITKSDLIFYLFYSLFCFALIQSVYTYNMERKGKEERAKIFRVVCRVVYPFLIFFGLFSILH